MKKTTDYAFYLLSLVALLSCQQKQSEISTNNSYLEEITVSQLREGYAKGTFTIEQVVNDYLVRIEAIDKNGPAINSIIYVNPNALEEAREL
ncbi:MAG: amidase, partial [Bacteroidia bacterium]|nr:amidase [Bacteroidia bacterium]